MNHAIAQTSQVPCSNIIGEENQGFKVVMVNFNSERMGMSAAMEAASRVSQPEGARSPRKAVFSVGPIESTEGKEGIEGEGGPERLDSGPSVLS